jgi:hypothetical protein
MNHQANGFFGKALPAVSRLPDQHVAEFCLLIFSVYVVKAYRAHGLTFRNGLDNKQLSLGISK